MATEAGAAPRPPPVRHGAGGHAASVDVRRRVCVRGPRATKFARHLGSPCAPPNGTHSAISSRGARPTHLANASAACNPTDVPGGGGAERGLEVAGRFFMRFSFCGLGSGAAGDVTLMEAHLIWVLGLDFVKRVPQVPIQKEGFRFPSASWGASACFPEKTGKKHRATGGGGGQQGPGRVLDSAFRSPACLRRPRGQPGRGPGRGAGVSSALRIRESGGGGETELPGAGWAPGGRAWRPVSGAAFTSSRRPRGRAGSQRAVGMVSGERWGPIPAREVWGAAVSSGDAGEGRFRRPWPWVTPNGGDGTAAVPGAGAGRWPQHRARRDFPALGPVPWARRLWGRFPCGACGPAGTAADSGSCHCHCHR